MNNKSKLQSFRSLLSTTEFSLILIVALFFILLSVFTDSFLTEYNVTNILKQSSISGIIAIAATLVIISGGIDLSVGSITGMSSMMIAMFMSKFQMDLTLAIILAVLIGGAFGLFNGVIIKEFKIAPFIATLGTMTIIRGLVKIICEARTIVGVYPEFAKVADETILYILPKIAIIWIVISILAALMIRYLRFGRNIFVMGCSEEVAKLSGINIRLNMYAVYTLAGLLCGVAGILLTARINSSIPTGGSGYEMTAIAAAVIGGASLAGGKGSIGGTFLGTLLMVIISNGGIQLGIDPFILEVTTGFLIILAVVLDQVRNKKLR